MKLLCFPAVKHKGVDPAEKSGVPSRTPVTSETESDDDRDAQIRIDAKVAAAWHDSVNDAVSRKNGDEN